MAEKKGNTELDKLLFPSNSTNVTFRSSRKQITNTAGNSTTATTQQKAQTLTQTPSNPYSVHLQTQQQQHT